jgi:hypothetical protein
MATRVFLLCVISALLLGGVIRADDSKLLPSRQARVVMPLLNKISPQDSPQSVLDRIRKILGDPDMSESGGPQIRFTTGDYYWLDDKTKVCVGSLNGKFAGVSICLPGQSFVTLYLVPKS